MLFTTLFYFLLYNEPDEVEVANAIALSFPKSDRPKKECTQQHSSIHRILMLKQ
ncbi:MULTISPECIES: hypothetical protein [unclassified Microcoleus]|uniref:hypothetical protein n=1 Tax=unclassified Microcoleus TaxID=2642155 RepID=UPI002FCEE511